VTDYAPTQLGFEQLDELAFALSADRRLDPPQTKFQAKNLGTIIELLWLNRAGLSVPKLRDLADTRRVRLVQAMNQGERTAFFQSETRCSSIICCYWEKDEEPDDWYSFCALLQKAAVGAGFPKTNAQELVAATRELVSNIYDHSKAPGSGIASFSAIDNELEIVVADQGIGVLESLRTSQDFKNLRDSGEALEAALTDGTSRFGRMSGHGGGFRNLFRGLLNLSGNLRFRSGDHSLQTSGISPGLHSARISQQVQLPGFIVSTTCNTGNS
jgi:hypothetical protein